jgi:chemotaxis protein methyltransferase CheR
MTAPKNHYLDAICSHITERSGIGFDERKREQLARIVQTRCEALGVNHAGIYYGLLRAGSEKGNEFNTLMDLLTIQESFFFRHKAQFDALRQVCLPALMQKKGLNRRINIWSAGCANGEEVYSIAMIVRDLIPNQPESRVFIKGTDISGRALRSAREGVYSKRAVRGIPPDYLTRYFTREGDRFALGPEIKGMVAFEWVNLAEAPFSPDAMTVWDIIFCRNVIIYFTKSHSQRLMTNFYASLAEGGFLFAGSSETMRYLNEDFVPIQMEDAFIYQKPPAGAKSAPPRLPPPLKDSMGCYPAVRVKGKKGPPSDQRTRPPSLPAPAPALTPGNASMKELERPETAPVDARLSLAATLADKGETMDAVALIDDIIRQDPLHVKAYFMLAMISRNAGDPEQAAQYLKKVIYLEPDNPLARLHLADIFKETSRREHAAREYVNVIALLENRADLENEVYGDGFTGKAILDAARAHLKSIVSIE